jgi:pterin-4a-carbinolamine dehydratase
VEVKLTTHSVKGLSKLDFDLAGFMDKAADHH